MMGLRQREIAKWTAIPCSIVWLMLMTVIWLFLLGWTKIISGHFMPIEIIMTLIIGTACVAGLIAAFRWQTSVSWIKGLFISVIFAVFQLSALRLSFLPFLMKDPIIFLGR
jgi:hypothetical protein